MSNWHVKIDWCLGLKMDLISHPLDEVQGVVCQVEVPGWSMEGRSGITSVMAPYVTIQYYNHLKHLLQFHCSLSAGNCCRPTHLRSPHVSHLTISSYVSGI